MQGVLFHRGWLYTSISSSLFKTREQYTYLHVLQFATVEVDHGAGDQDAAGKPPFIHAEWDAHIGFHHLHVALLSGGPKPQHKEKNVEGRVGHVNEPENKR